MAPGNLNSVDTASRLREELAEAQREIERSHEIIIEQNEEIVKAKADAARWENNYVACEEKALAWLESAKVQHAKLRAALEQVDAIVKAADEYDKAKAAYDEALLSGMVGGESDDLLMAHGGLRSAVQTWRQAAPRGEAEGGGK